MFKKLLLILLTLCFSFSLVTTVSGDREGLYNELTELENILHDLIKLLDFDLEVDTGVGTEGIPVNFRFNENLRQGSRGSSVKYLQILMNKDTATKVSEAGAGSPGNETEYFGPATLNAVKRFQQKYADEVLKPIGLSYPTGFVGSYTRTKLNAILSGDYTITPSSPPDVPTPPAPSPTPDPSPDPSPTPDPTPDSDPDPEPEPDPDPTPDPEPVSDDPCGGQASFIDIRNGQRYSVVEIGSQCWMAENLNYETENSWCYGNESRNCDNYGRMYNFEGAKDICPTGWDLPSDNDFKTMERAIGMTETDTGKTGWRGTDQGEKLKCQTDWDGSNQTGFSALPAGGREAGGFFVGISNGTSFWTSTESGSSAWSRQLFSGRAGINRTLFPKDSAVSVRCIKVF